MSAKPIETAERLLEAAAWQMRLAEDETLRGAFEEWHAHPPNAQAWAQLMAPWNLIGEHANDQKMVAFRQAALSDAQHARAQLNGVRPRWGAWIAAAAAAVVIVGLGTQWLGRPDDYATGFGERRVVTLADGSKVSLDSGSEVTVRFTRTARELHLLRGQARFDVAHDVEKPFSVVARDQKVIATGTAFNIDMTQPKVLVTLIEGHVVVLDENAPAQARTLDRAAPRPPSVELHAGQQLAALPDRVPTVAPTDVQQVVAWTNGQLVFDDQPLSEVVARVNHYTSAPITLADDKAGALRISGSFNTGDVAGFLDIVTRYLPVREVVDDSGRVTLQKK
jgi:transmembrane sensor